ncbi:MAG: RNA-binding transcriptional accessory protein [Lachnospiraceae bacterium]|nr:RNA-binding transcriptional accessory protein [Lachnospiraceae bacterium]
MDIAGIIARELNIRKNQVEAVASLIDEGNTIPFIARYRKEAHGGLDDEQIRAVDERLTYLRNLQEKKEQVINSITEQGKMTDELMKAIEAASTQVAVDDIYRPYRPKRRTRAMIAKERGLEGLAGIILLQMTKNSLESEAGAYVDPEKEVPDEAAALAGAGDIIAENISDEAEYRDYIRRVTFEKGSLTSEAKDETANTVYEKYYKYTSLLKRVAGFEVLAINRAEKEDVLKVNVVTDREGILKYLENKIIVRDNPYTAPFLREVIADAFDRLIWPSVEREIRNMLTEKAEEGAIKVFSKNLTQLLMQPPIAGHVVLGWDPGYRNGCKIAVVDATGKILDTALVFPTAPFNKVEETKRVIKKLIDKHKVTLIALGNGTASRESEQLIVEMLHEMGRNISYVIVNEAGASVYSASKEATEEMPDRNVGERSSASMARRLQDPLAELVKIDPKALGVGQYQHDMNQKRLDETLSGVVEDCVNHVGVDLNTASVPLLTHVAGINKTIAKNIVAYREANGRFKSRHELLKVAKLGPKAYEQCAGFLRIPGAKNPLDATAVHPESYETAEKVLKTLKLTPSDIGKNKGIAKSVDVRKLAGELGVGAMTLSDILKELDKPGRDPREDMPAPILRADVLELEQLKEGMILKGTVRNVIDFGAFVDIGVHTDGLVHISQLSDKRVNHPSDVVSVGDVVEVKIVSVDVAKKRIGLSMKGLNK